MDPLANAIGISHYTTISATFDQPLDETTISPANFSLHGEQTAFSHGEHSVRYDSLNQTLILTPSVPFKPGEKVEAGVTSGVRAIGGMSIVPYAWHFTSETRASWGLFRRDAERHYTDYGLKSVVLGDVDNDGDLDTLVANSYTDNISVFQNQGNEALDSKVDYALRGRPDLIKLGDIDNDGNLDILVTNVASDSLSVLQNLGDGTFAPQIDHPVGDNPTSFALGDVDGDGNLDALVANEGADSISILKNLDNGALSSRVDYTIGDTPQSIAVADVDGDGDMDILTVNEADYPTSNNLSVLQNLGQGIFSPSVHYAMEDDPRFVTTGDVDNDGDLDTLVMIYGYNTDFFSVWENQGDGSFATPMYYAIEDRFQSVGMADVDGDGDLDALVVKENTDSFSVLENQGNGTFNFRTDYTAEGNPQSIAIGDLDDDGDLDTLVASINYLEVFENYELVTFELDSDREYVTLTPLTYTIRMTNHSTAKAEGVWVSEHLPSGMVYVPGSIQGSGADDSQAPLLRWDVGTVPTTTHVLTLAFQAMAGSVTDGETVTRTLRWSCDKCREEVTQHTLIADVQPPLTPTLLYPPTGAYTYTRRLVWTPVTDTLSGLKEYRVRLNGPDGSHIFTTTVSHFLFGPAYDINLPDGVYTWTVQAVDIVGNHSKSEAFTFTLDTPEVMARAPAANALAVPRTTIITATFDQPMSATTFTSKTFAMRGSQTVFSSTFHSLNYNPLKRTVVLTPSTFFHPGEVLEVAATRQLRTTTGKSAMPYVWRFIAKAEAAAGKFTKNLDYAVGNGPASVAVSDVDGDGDLDVLVANSYDNSLSVLRNRGEGIFAPHIDYAVGNGPTSVAMSDVDGDGDLDALVTNSNDDSLSLLCNQGDGTFAPHVTYAVGNHPYSVAVGDVDGDGNLDALVTNSNDNSLSLLRNQGNGTFAPHVTYAVGNGPYSVAVGDVDGDGNLDALVTNSNDNSLSLLRNLGDGNFTSQVIYTVGDYPRAVAVGDVDGDGDLDALVINRDDDSLVVLRNLGDGTFAPHIAYAVGDGPLSVAVGDVDGDGDLDALVTNYYDDSLSLLRNLEDGTFAPRIDYAVGNGPCSVAVSDVDGDGDLDALVANYHDDDLSFLRNSNVFTFRYFSKRRPIAITYYRNATCPPIAHDNFAVLWNNIECVKFA